MRNLRGASLLLAAGLLGSGCPADDNSPGANETEDDDGAAPSSGDDNAGTRGATTSGSDATTTNAATSGIDDSGGSDGATTTGPATGCGVDPGFAGAVATEIDVDGTMRRFLIVLPDGFDPSTPYPLVFMLHGRGGDGELLRMYAGVEEAASGGAIFVYPDGLPIASMANQTGWELTANGRDVAFIDAIYAQLVDNLCIDESRVYASGHSYGGFFTNTLGCVRGERFRAIAPVAGGGPGQEVCEGQVASWVAHGTDDMVVPTVLGEMSAAAWAGYNGCSERSAPTAPDPCVAYSGCDEGYEVTWCLHSEEGFGIGTHTWPSFAGAAIWDFFTTH
jgi:poly(3-hydroxybutyrate) depolymerase